MNRKASFTALAAGLLTMATPFAEGSVTSAKIDQLLITDYQDVVYVYPLGGPSGGPSCAGSTPTVYSFSMTRPGPKSISPC